jgi:hypothetical protein
MVVLDPGGGCRGRTTQVELDGQSPLHPMNQASTPLMQFKIPAFNAGVAGGLHLLRFVLQDGFHPSF